MESWPRRARCIVTGGIAGWCAATVLSCWLIPHPLLHSEFEQPEWRAVVLTRVLRTAPYLLLAPPIAGLLIGFIRYQRGWNGFPKLDWRVARHLLFVTSLLWILQLALLWWYAVLLQS